MNTRDSYKGSDSQHRLSDQVSANTDEHQASRVKPALMLLPPSPPPGDVGAILLAGVQAFF
jgi:hypothetical protein